MPLSDISQSSLTNYVKACSLFLNNHHNIRGQLLERDRAYAREQDYTERQRILQLKNRTGTPTTENITIPVVMPQVESATAFLSETFLTSYPIFPILSKAQLSSEALQMETLIGEQSIRFGWVPELLMTFRDGLKYNIAAMEVDWQNKRIYSLPNDTSTLTAMEKATATETYTQGNYLRRLNMYNVIMDTRVAMPAEMHIKGEFAGYVELLGRVALKQLFSDLGSEFTMNATKAFESNGGVYSSQAIDSGYYVPEINPNALLQQSDGLEFDWFNWAGVDTNTKIKYQGMYEVIRLYARIIPSDHGITGPAKNTPQIWKLIVVNRQTLIYAERQTNAHNFLGVVFSQPNEDGLGWQTKSFAENVIGIQQGSSALYNSAIESQRRKVYDRLLYNPTLVNKADIDNVSSVARIPVKQAAYGVDLSKAIYQVPYRDEGVAGILAMSREMVQMGNLVNGTNPVQQGQFQKGNKTRQEFNDTMGNSDARLRMMALVIEYRFLQPIKEMVKLNTLQFQPPVTLFNRLNKESVKIDPSAIRSAALEFRVADGLMPVDKIMNTELFSSIFQMAQGNPQMQAEYDLMGAYFYFLQLQGASWISEFRRTPVAQKAALTNQQALNGASTTTPDGTQQPAPTQALQ